ncbi:MAG: DUF3624 family protein [Chloroflexota bacterium]
MNHDEGSTTENRQDQIEPTRPNALLLRSTMTGIPAKAKALALAKLGRCHRCIRSSALGSLLSWAIFALVGLVWPAPIPLALTLAGAVFFTLLMLAHLVVFTARLSAARQRMAKVQVETGVPAAGRLSRRQFLFQAGATFAAVLWARPAGTVAARCRAVPQTHSITGTGCTKDDAKTNWLDQAVDYCGGVCSARDNCGTQQCVNWLVSRGEWTFVRIVDQACGGYRWEATATIVRCNCRCE